MSDLYSNELLDSLPEGLKIAILVLIPLVAAIILYLIVFKSVRLFTRNETVLKREYTKLLRLPFIFILFLFVLMQEIEVLSFDFKYLDKLIKIGWIFAIALLLIRITSIGRLVILEQYDITSNDNLKARKVTTQIRVFERVVYVLIVILAVGLALMTFESIRQIGLSILTSAGIAGIIVGLAAQKLIGNLLAGMQIALTQPIRLEDVVIVEGDFGWVEEINLTYVVVRIWDKRRVVLPATYFIEKPFQNWTRQKSDLFGTVFFYLDYKAPIQQIRDKLTEIVAGAEKWDGLVCNLQVTNCTEKTVELRAMVSAKSAPEAWDLRVYTREKMITYLQENFPEYLPKVRVEMDKDHPAEK